MLFWFLLLSHILKAGNLEISNKIKKVSMEKYVIPLVCLLLSFNSPLKVLSLFVRNKLQYCIKGCLEYLTVCFSHR